MEDRRHFLKTLATGSALMVAWHPLHRSWVTDAHSAGPAAPLVAVPPLDGTLRTDPATLQGFAQDFGRLLVRQPLAVLRPGSLNDIVTIMRFARQQRLTVAMNGQSGPDEQRESHSQFGQAHAPAGIVIDVTPLSTIHGIDAQAGVADVDAGVSWAALCEAAAEYGVAPAVLTDYLHLSVGGTVSVGGIGGHTLHRRTGNAISGPGGSSSLGPSGAMIRTTCSRPGGGCSNTAGGVRQPRVAWSVLLGYAFDASGAGRTRPEDTPLSTSRREGWETRAGGHDARVDTRRASQSPADSVLCVTERAAA